MSIVASSQSKATAGSPMRSITGLILLVALALDAIMALLGMNLGGIWLAYAATWAAGSAVLFWTFWWLLRDWVRAILAAREDEIAAYRRQFARQAVAMTEKEVENDRLHRQRNAFAIAVHLAAMTLGDRAPDVLEILRKSDEEAERFITHPIAARTRQEGRE